MGFSISSLNPVNVVKGGYNGAKGAAKATVSAGKNAVEGAVKTTKNVAKAGAGAAKDVVEFSSTAVDLLTDKNVAIQNARAAGNFVRSIPGYKEITQANEHFNPAIKALDATGSFLRRNSDVAGRALTAHSPLAFIPGKYGEQIRGGAVDFVADTLETPGNLTRDPAGVVEAGVLATTPGGSRVLAENYYQSTIGEHGVAGGAHRAGLDLSSFFLPLPKGAGIISNTAGGAGIAQDLTDRIDVTA